MGVCNNKNTEFKGGKTMNFYDKVTGNDIKKEFLGFEERAKELPASFQEAWEQIKNEFWLYSDFTGRNLMPIFNNIMNLLEETAMDGQTIEDVFGEDIKGFCIALASEEGVKNYRDKWRDQLNRNVAKKLEGLK